MRVEVLDGVERRRRWTDDQRLSILMEVGLRGATVTDVARRHAVSRSRLYAWRCDLKRHGALRPSDAVEGRPVFVPVASPLLPAPSASPSTLSMPDEAEGSAPQIRSDDADVDGPATPTIEIALANGRRLERAGGDRGRGAGASDPGGGGGVIGLGTGVRVYLACGATDMRKGIAGLSALAQDVLRQDPAGGAVFAFRGKRGDRLKLLYWDGQGFCLYYKVLQKGRFPWPMVEAGAARLTSGQLAMLWEGIDWRRPHWGAPPARVG